MMQKPIAYNFVHCFEYDDCFSKKIEERAIEKVENFNLIVDVLLNETKNELTDIQKYAVGKIARINEMYDINKYTVETKWAYYGYEPDVVLYENIEEVKQEIAKIVEMNDNQVVEYILILEYGYILEQLQNKKWIIKNINIDNIYAGNKEYLRKVEKNNVYNNVLNPDNYEYKENKNMILGIVTGDRLWDGYHRYCAAKKNNLKNGNFLIGE